MGIRENNMIKGRDARIASLNTAVSSLNRKVEKKDLFISILCKELDEALSIIYGKDKAPDLTAERILQDVLSDMGKHNQQIYL